MARIFSRIGFQDLRIPREKKNLQQPPRKLKLLSQSTQESLIICWNLKTENSMIEIPLVQELTSQKTLHLQLMLCGLE